MMPKNAVKMNDEWKIDMKDVTKKLGSGDEMELDADKAKGTGKLVKVYMKDGKQFGEIQINLELPIKSIGKGEKASEGSKVTVNGTLDVCIDGSSYAGTAKLKSQVMLTAMPMGVAVTVTADIESNESQTDGKK
jgi:hypothetical protein